MKRTFLVCAPLLLAAGHGVADEIYKSIDAEGRVVYSDRPPAGEAEVDDAERSVEVEHLLTAPSYHPDLMEHCSKDAEQSEE